MAEEVEVSLQKGTSSAETPGASEIAHHLSQTACLQYASAAAAALELGTISRDVTGLNK
jgi:hypothetical protein